MEAEPTNAENGSDHIANDEEVVASIIRTIRKHKNQVFYGVSAEGVSQVKNLLKNSPYLSEFKRKIRFHYFAQSQKFILEMENGVEADYSLLVIGVSTHFGFFLRDMGQRYPPWAEFLEQVKGSCGGSIEKADQSVIRPDFTISHAQSAPGVSAVVIDVAVTQTLAKVNTKLCDFMTHFPKTKKAIALKVNYGTPSMLAKMVIWSRGVDGQLKYEIHTIRNADGTVAIGVGPQLRLEDVIDDAVLSATNVNGSLLREVLTISPVELCKKINFFDRTASAHFGKGTDSQWEEFDSTGKQGDTTTDERLDGEDMDY